MKTHLNGDWGISIGPPALGSPLSGGVALPFDQYHLVSARNMFNFDFKTKPLEKFSKIWIQIFSQGFVVIENR
jgi:hypothetical protein